MKVSKWVIGLGVAALAVVAFVAYLIYKAFQKAADTAKDVAQDVKCTTLKPQCGSDKAKCDADNTLANLPLIGGLLKQKRDCNAEYKGCMGDCYTPPEQDPKVSTFKSEPKPDCGPGKVAIPMKDDGINKADWRCITSSVISIDTSNDIRDKCSGMRCPDGYTLMYENGRCECKPTGTGTGIAIHQQGDPINLDIPNIASAWSYKYYQKYGTGASVPTWGQLGQIVIDEGSPVQFRSKVYYKSTWNAGNVPGFNESTGFKGTWSR